MVGEPVFRCQQCKAPIWTFNETIEINKAVCCPVCEAPLFDSFYCQPHSCAHDHGAKFHKTGY